MKLRPLVALGLLAVLGALAAFAISPGAARAYSIYDAANLGYSVTDYLDSSTHCHTYAIKGYGASTMLGVCSDPNFDADLDAFILATDPNLQPATTTVAQPTTTAPVTTTTIAPVSGVPIAKHGICVFRAGRLTCHRSK